MNGPLLYFNGIDGATGDYVLHPRTLEEFAQLLEQGVERPVKPRHLKFGVNALNLSEAGWGIIWPENPDPEIRAALATLLQHRQARASCLDETLFKQLTYLPGETTLEFWRRHGLGPDAVDPARMPYYLLIVGSPDDIPFEFQFELGIPYAVGRLFFDKAEDYAEYASRLIASEDRLLPDAPTIAFFGVENPDDPPTRASIEKLVKPLEEKIANGRQDWRVRTLLRQAADKAQLVGLLGGDRPPALLFTASHAMCYRPGSPRQATHQGALLCADWPGRKAWEGRGSIPDDFLFSARDLAGDVRLDGLVAFHFACYTAGTSRFDPYADDDRQLAADQPFVASLPKGLLRQGALAVVGHVDVALEQSFLWHDAGSQLTGFESTLRAIMDGHPVGHAMGHFRDRVALLGALVVGARKGDEESNDLRRFQLRTAFHDARNYILLGDPGARLRIERTRTSAASPGRQGRATLP